MIMLLYAVFATQAALAGLLALLVVAGHGRLAVRTGAVLVAATAMAVAAVGSTLLLGHSKPIRLEFRPLALAQAEILAWHPIEGEAIHLWLLPPSGNEPRALVLPWDRARAERMVEAFRAAGRSGGRVELELGRGEGRAAAESDLVVHVAPPPALPPKTVPVPQG